MNTVTVNSNYIKFLKKTPNLGINSLICIFLALYSLTLNANDEISSLLNITDNMRMHTELTETFNNPLSPISERKNRQLQRIIKAARPVLLKVFNDPNSGSSDILLALKISTALRLNDKVFLDIYIHCLKNSVQSVSKEASRSLSQLLADDWMLLDKINGLNFTELSYPFAKYDILAEYAKAGSAEAQILLIQYLIEQFKTNSKEALSTNANYQTVKKQLIDKLSDNVAQLNWNIQNEVKINHLLSEPDLYLRKSKIQTQFSNHDIYLLNPILVRWLEELGQKKFLFRSQPEDISFVFQLIHKNKNNSLLSELLKIQMLKIAVHKKQLSLSDHLMLNQVLNTFIHDKLNAYIAEPNNLKNENLVSLIIQLSNLSIITKDPDNNFLLQKSIAILIKNQRSVCQKIYP